MKIEKLIPGMQIDLPEVAGPLGQKNSKFEITSIFPGGMGVCLKLKNLFNQTSYCLKSVRSDLIGEKRIFVRFLDELEVWLSASECDGVTEALAIVRIDEIPTVLATWMEGGDLANAKSNLSPSQKVECLIRVVRTLNWVQNNLGVIHRDLKPSNILLDTDLKAYISDWGLARPISNAILKITENRGLSKYERPDRTQLGEILGTAPYIAPEQINNSSKIDHRADIYSLGCIMYELETGLPPFIGKNSQEILLKQLNVAPPPLKKMFVSTNLGLENIIARCLKKSPEERYATYTELESDLLIVASKRNFSLKNCDISEREKKYQLGKGHDSMNQIVKNAPIKGKGMVLLEFDEIAPFLQESSDLIALGRYKEAEQLLYGFYNPDILKNSSSWNFGHSIALNYALCIQKIDGRLNEALKIYETIKLAENQPVELFINYSLALLQKSRWIEAKEICQNGLSLFPDDLDLLGNYTISLMNCNEIEFAYKNAMHRLHLRRDVHSIEEAISVLSLYRDHLRDRDLPQAIQISKLQYELIKEGLSLNPFFASLHLAQIKLLFFIHDQDNALKTYQKLSGENQVSSIYKQIAFADIIEGLGEFDSAQYETALELVEKFKHVISFEPSKNRIQYIKWKIYAERYMIGKDNKDGERIVIKEVVDFFLPKNRSEYPYPFMAAKILDWMGDFQNAENIILSILEKSPQNWEVFREYIFMLIRNNQLNEALIKAKEIIKMAPWRAESYDVLSYAAKQSGDSQLSFQMKEQGNEIINKEIVLFDTLRNVITL